MEAIQINECEQQDEGQKSLRRTIEKGRCGLYSGSRKVEEMKRLRRKERTVGRDKGEDRDRK